MLVVPPGFVAFAERQPRCGSIRAAGPIDSAVDFDGASYRLAPAGDSLKTRRDLLVSVNVDGKIIAEAREVSTPLSSLSSFPFQPVVQETRELKELERPFGLKTDLTRALEGAGIGRLREWCPCR